MYGVSLFPSRVHAPNHRANIASSHYRAIKFPGTISSDAKRKLSHSRSKLGLGKFLLCVVRRITTKPLSTIMKKRAEPGTVHTKLGSPGQSITPNTCIFCCQLPPLCLEDDLPCCNLLSKIHRSTFASCTQEQRQAISSF